MKTTEEWFEMREKYLQGVSISQIAREEGVDRKTARKYALSPTPPKRRKRKKRGSKLDPYKPYIKKRLKRWNLSAQKLFEEIQERGYTGGYTLVKTFVRPIKRDTATQAEIRYETKPGEQAQVDWFDFGPIEVDGKRKRLWCFSMIMGYSRTRFVTYTTDAKTTTFIKCHSEAFRYFGGYPTTILYDNTKNVVLKRALKSSDSTWNPLYEDFFSYYGFTPRLCRPGKRGAKTKGKIERTGQYIRGNFFMGLEFDSITDLNHKALAWCNKVNAKVHGTTYEIPFERMKTEISELNPIDARPPYQIVVTECRKISRDCYISYLANKYSVPWQYAGREAKLLITDGTMAVEVGGEIVCTHTIVEGRHRRIRVKAHFEGLLKTKLDENKNRHIRRLSKQRQSKEPQTRVTQDLIRYPIVEVEHRDLTIYDELLKKGGE